MKENIEEDLKKTENLIECFRKAEIVNLECKESMYQRCNYSHYKAIEHILSDYKRVLKENEELKEEDLMSQRALDIFDERKYRKKYLEERRAEEPNLLYPDADEIYERYYKLKEENEKLKEAVEIYKGQVETKIDAYIDSNYLSKQKIQDKIEELEEKRIKMEKDDIGVGFTLGEEWSDLKSKIKAYKDLLEEKGE